jgi:acetyltransferase-like isoleucine patch superfamily enzyme
MSAPSKLTGLTPFAAENGWLLLTEKIAGAAMRRLRDAIVARRLKTTGMRLGRAPRLVGLAHLKLGANFSAGDRLWLEAVTSFADVEHQPLITIGPNVNFSNDVHVACTNRVTIGEGMLAGSHVIISDHSHGIYTGNEQSSPETPPVQRRLSSDKAVTIGRNVWLGDGVAVLAGANIGDGTIIGANSVVNGVIPASCIAAGAPARPIRHWDAHSKQWIRWNETTENPQE